MKYLEILTAARAAGDAAADAASDLGSCNFDHVLFEKPRGKAWDLTAEDELRLGLSYSVRGMEMRARVGQAGKRTAFAEAAERTIRSYGVPAYVVYLAD